MPAEMQEAILVVETGFTPEELDSLPQPILERIMLYKEIRGITIAGGTFDG
jgi:hypothetical protein